MNIQEPEIKEEIDIEKKFPRKSHKQEIYFLDGIQMAAILLKKLKSSIYYQKLTNKLEYNKNQHNKMYKI